MLFGATSTTRLKINIANQILHSPETCWHFWGCAQPLGEALMISNTMLVSFSWKETENMPDWQMVGEIENKQTNKQKTGYCLHDL